MKTLTSARTEVAPATGAQHAISVSREGTLKPSRGRASGLILGGTLALVLGWLAAGNSWAAEQSPAKSSPDALNLYADAATFQKEKAFELAADEWEKFLTQYPNDPLALKARYYAGVCQLQLKQYAKAAAHFEAVAAKRDNFELAEDTLLNLAWCQYSLGGQGKPEEYAKAVETFAALTQEFPASKYGDQASFYGGEALYALGRKDEATAAYRELIDKYKDSPLRSEAMYALGVAFEDLKKFTDAAAIYDGFLTAYADTPLAAEVRMRKAETVLQSGRPAEAEKMFAEVAATPGFESVDHALARQAYCAAAQDAFARAGTLYARVATDFPQSSAAADAALSAGRCFYRAQQDQEASLWLGRVLEAGGRDAVEAAHWLCRAYLRGKEPAKAAEVAERALRAPAESDFLVQLKMDQADALDAVPERRLEAIAAYRSIAETHPAHELAPQALYNAAFSSWETGQREQGLALAKEFLGKYAQHELAPDVKQVAAECELALGQHAAAETTFRDLLANHADHEAGRLSPIRLALALYLQKKYPEMVEVLTAAVSKLQKAEEVAEGQFLLGVGHFYQEQFPAAIEALTASIAASTSWRQADETLLLLSRAQSKTNQSPSAIATVRRLIADYPNSAILDQADYRLGEYCYAENDFAGAIAAYDELLAKWPQSAFATYAQFGRGWAMLKSQQYAEAAKAFSVVLADDARPDLQPDARLGRALCLRQQKQYAEAIRDLEAYLASNPGPSGKSDALYERGLCEVASENPAAAVQTLEALLQESPDSRHAANAIYELAWAYKKLDKPAESSAAFARLSREHGGNPLAAEAEWRLGEDCYERSEFEKAAGHYTAAKEKANPGEVDELATHKLGWALFNLKSYDAALQQFREQLQEYPQSKLQADALFMQGECLFHLGKHEDALTAFAAADKAQPSQPKMRELTLLHAGQSAAELGRWQDSIRWLDQLTTRYPDSAYLADALGKRGWARQQIKKLDEALGDYEKAAALSRGEAGAQARFLIGEMQFERKEYNGAIKSFQRVMYGYGGEAAPPEVKHWQAMAGYEAGRCAEVQIPLAENKEARSQHRDDATKYFTYVAERHASHKLAGEARQRLAALAER